MPFVTRWPRSLQAEGRVVLRTDDCGEPIRARNSAVPWASPSGSFSILGASCTPMRERNCLQESASLSASFALFDKYSSATSNEPDIAAPSKLSMQNRGLYSLLTYKFAVRLNIHVPSVCCFVPSHIPSRIATIAFLELIDCTNEDFCYGITEAPVPLSVRVDIFAA